MILFHTLKLYQFPFSIGSKNFQERCERIRNTLHSNGIEGEPTMAKCKQLKKQLKLKEEIAGLDPSVIIESKDENDGRPKRTTRTATRRNYVYDDQFDGTKSSNTKDGATTQLLQKMREFIDSDSEYDEVNEHSQNGNNNNNGSNDSVDFANVMDTMTVTNGQNGNSVSNPMLEHNNKLKPSTETQVITDNQSISANISEPAHV